MRFASSDGTVRVHIPHPGRFLLAALAMILANPLGYRSSSTDQFERPVRVSYLAGRFW